MATSIRTGTPILLSEKEDLEFIQQAELSANPVVESAEFAYRVHLRPISKSHPD